MFNKGMTVVWERERRVGSCVTLYDTRLYIYGTTGGLRRQSLIAKLDVSSKMNGGSYPTARKPPDNPHRRPIEQM